MKVRLREHARAAARAGRDGHEPSRDARRRALRPRARPAAVPRAARRRHARPSSRGLTTKQKVPYVIRILDPASLTDRAAASLVEVKETVSTWPQLASDVALGGAMVANAVRRIALGELTALRALLRRSRRADRRRARRSPLRAAARSRRRRRAGRRRRGCRRAAPARPRATEIRFVVACATSAPSGGNMQPWRFEARRRTSSAPGSTRRARRCWTSAAAPRCSRSAPRWRRRTIGARALGFEPVAAHGAATGRCGSSRSSASTHARDEARGRAPVAALLQPAHRRLAADPERRARAARAPRRAARRARRRRRRARASSAPRWARWTACASSPPRLRRDLIGELRFTAAEAHASRDGIDVASLELDGADRAAMDVLRTGAGMDVPGAARPRLGPAATPPATRSRRRAARSCCARRPSTGAALVDAGRGLHAAVARGDAPRAGRPPVGLAVPVPAPARGPATRSSEWERTALTDAAGAFERVSSSTATARSCSSCASRAASPPSVRSLRRPVDEVLAFAA